MESQQAQAQELQGALGRERELSTQLRQQKAARSPTDASAQTPEGDSPDGVSRAERGCSQVRIPGG